MEHKRNQTLQEPNIADRDEVKVVITIWQKMDRQKERKAFNVSRDMQLKKQNKQQ